MDVTTGLVVLGAGQLITLIGAVAYCRARVGTNSDRIKRLEQLYDDGPKNYVPRPEIERALAGIETTGKQTYALVQALIYAGGNPHLALKSIEAAADFAADQDLIQAYRPIAVQHEGLTQHMYLDTDGLVTFGIGCMLPSAAEACKLPWRHQISEVLATSSEIEADFERVRSLPKGQFARFYFRSSSLILRPVDIEAQYQAKCDGFIGQLRSLFPAFSSYPLPAMLALLDMIFNLGLGRAPHDDFKGSGLQQYPHMVASVLERKFKAAAQECGRNTHDHAFDARNEWTANCFLKAATL